MTETLPAGRSRPVGRSPARLRPGLRWAIGLGAMIALGPLIPMPSHAQAPWLMDYLSGWSAPPGGLVAGQPAVITLEGWFPYDCGRVTGATVVDSGHVEFSLRRIDSCAVDTSRLWSRSFDLGILHPGDHTLHLKRVFNSGQPGDSAIASGTFTFQVDAPNPQPPPPPGTPPDFPSFQARCLTGWYTEPYPATEGVPVSLVVWGWYPYECGRVADAVVLDPGHVALTLRPGPACADTGRTWSQSFPLGLLAKGGHWIEVDLRVLEDPRDSTTLRTAEVSIAVGEDPATEPAPNPFVDGTSLSVTAVENAARARIDIYDLRGGRVASLFDGPLAAGPHVFHWNCLRSDGSRAPEGIYFSRFAMAGRVVTRRLVLLPR